mgnify:CR=1 FL=1
MPGIGKELAMEFKNEHQKLLLNLIYTSNWLKHMDGARLKPFGLSPQQYNILRILRGAKGKRMCMQEVLQRMLDRAPNATRLTDKLISKGLVLRERSEADRRVVHLLISTAGNELLDQIGAHGMDGLEAVAGKLSISEAAAMNLGLDKMRS